MSDSDSDHHLNRFDSVRDMPPSVKLVFYVLRREGELTQNEIREHTRLSPRTVRYALDQLEEASIVTSRLYIPDARKQVYSLVSELQATRFHEDTGSHNSGESDTGEVEDIDD